MYFRQDSFGTRLGLSTAFALCNYFRETFVAPPSLTAWMSLFFLFLFDIFMLVQASLYNFFNLVQKVLSNERRAVE